MLAADLLAGNEDPRRDAPELLRRALAALLAAARAGRIRLRADAGYFAGQLARAALSVGPHAVTPPFARRRALAGLGVERAIELCAGPWTAAGLATLAVARPLLDRFEGADRAG